MTWLPELSDPTLPGSVGICIHRPRRRVALEPFWMQYVRGVEETLAAHGMTLLLEVVLDAEAEVATFRRWAAGDRIGGVIVTDVRADDVRIPALRGLGLPAVLIGSPGEARDFSTVSTDDAAVATSIVAHLAERGHRRVARISGPAEFRHTGERTAAFDEAARAVGMTFDVIEGDYTAESGDRGTRDVLAGRPTSGVTAIVYDNDVMAITGLATVRAAGLDVPGDLALLAWDDSVQCQLTVPPLTAMSHDIAAYGVDSARALLDVLAGAPRVDRRAAQPVLVPRGSTASRWTVVGDPRRALVERA
ncbi:LacI family DNA-binding transcriptional regulator [Curtobacterium sp. ISL-83]|uniref:LacI family DNA-binding transcriptional regulator n=1 Tax=Curtobacterium sp. ISL-83 TaxID=2819145 RepID=UPI001BE9BDF2|nr:substrate-binding domain-containing protein [Curtobacterium sp. ISL-83]MBT2501124.1 substrate-binding domain-containing protein [Curtobacterium sp. ISL-83]